MFLNMDIKVVGRKKFAVSMSHHVDEDKKDLGETLKRNVANPATSQLFTITI